MQPMVSPADHESRTSLFNDMEPSERTPLIARIPQATDGGGGGHQDTTTTVTVGVLLIILLSGITIGSYLLIEQGNEENVLPPVEMAVQFVSRAQWDPSFAESPPTNDSREPTPPHRARHVIAVQTDSDQCWNLHTCRQLLLTLVKDGNESTNCNFVVSSSGHTFEMLGWRRQSSLHAMDNSTALVLGFLGNFTSTSPPRSQKEEAKRFLDESVSQQYLHPSFTIIGRASGYPATYLFHWLQTLPHWDKQLSGT